jgi:sporulation protein YhbH
VAVVQPDYGSVPRGRADAARHREKVKEAIRKNLPGIISDEAIITRKGNKVVKVPIRGLKSYHFIHGHEGGASGGFGTGEDEKGKLIGRRPKPGRGQPGTPGDEPGVDYLETEVELEELIQMMLEDLGLPNLKEKEARETLVPAGWKYESVEKTGIWPRIDRKRTVKEGIRRTEILVAQLMRESGRSEGECRGALIAAQGAMERARALLAAGGVVPVPSGVPEAFLESADLRFRTIQEDAEAQSNAVVMAMMDVSGSMGTMKKYLARSFFFWMLSFLRSFYRRVDIRFIAHTTEARLVDEQDFFHKGESGGTRCASAYELAAELVDSTYPTGSWNVYPFHFSDGEDWDAERTVRAAQALMEKGVATLGYGEIQEEHGSSVLMQAFRDTLSLSDGRSEQLAYYEGAWGGSPFVGVVLRSREDLYPALRAILKPE